MLLLPRRIASVWSRADRKGAETLKATSANLKSGQNLGFQLLKSKGARDAAQQIFAQLLAEGVRLLNRAADINESNRPEKKNFGEKVRKAAEDVRAEERLRLAEYVLRRERSIGRTKQPLRGRRNITLSQRYINSSVR